MPENIEYLPKKSQFRVGDIKNLAVATNQKDDMIKMYPKVEINTVSNADMLSQSFGGNQTSVTEFPKVEPVNEQVQVSAIPNVQNSFNMEANPVDLSINQPVNNIPVIETPNLNIPSIDTQLNNTVSSIDNNLNLGNSNNAPIIEPINLNNGTTNSGFNLSNEPNIFDNPTPFAISQEEINKPIDNNIPSMESTVVPEYNIFGAASVGSTENNNNSIESKEEVNNSINDNILLAQIAIEESNVKHYEALAENSKKKIELLKRQVKNTKNEEINLENTASNLFNNNGVLDDEKVLGKTPMPNIMAA